MAWAPRRPHGCHNGRVLPPATAARRLLAPATVFVVALTSATVLVQIVRPGLVEALGASWPEIAQGQVWRLFTGTLVHGLGIPQLAVNMAALAVFGPGVERAIGGWRFTVAYFCAGGLVWLAVLLTIDRTFVGAGASAAVFAVMGAGVPLGLGQGGDRRWAALSAAAVAAGLGLGVVLVPVFGSDVLYAHVYGSAIGLLGGLVPGRVVPRIRRARPQRASTRA